jgi:hypothetical protein
MSGNGKIMADASAMVISMEGLSPWNAGETPGYDRASASMPGYFPIPYVKISAPMNRKAPPSRTDSLLKHTQGFST